MVLPDAQGQQPAGGAAVSGSVEASRRHGRFDLRWPTRTLGGADDRLAPVPVDLEDVPVGLDWDAFSTRSLRGNRRHDLEAISAYYTYQHGRHARRRARAGGSEARHRPTSGADRGGGVLGPTGGLGPPWREPSPICRRGVSMQFAEKP